MAVACDIHDLCGRDTGIIVIPTMATSTATITPSPTATIHDDSRRYIHGDTKAADTNTSIGHPVASEMSPEPSPTIRYRSGSCLVCWVYFMVIASASVVDPRPAALDRLRESIKLLLVTKQRLIER